MILALTGTFAELAVLSMLAAAGLYIALSCARTFCARAGSPRPRGAAQADRQKYVWRTAHWTVSIDLTLRCAHTARDELDD